MKKISAIFDGLKFSHATMAYAIKMAESSKALLSGVFLDDFLYHSNNVFDSSKDRDIFGEHIKKLQNEDKAIRQQSIAIFNAACIKAGINYVIHHDKSFAIDELLKESIYSDMLLIGADETMSPVKEEPPTSFIRSVLAATQCPVMVVPTECKAIEKVILLYDGKPSSVFAIKMFNYMFPWMRDLQTVVLSVTGAKTTLIFPDDPLIKEFVKCHYPNADYVLLPGEPEDKIPAYLGKAGQSSLIVMGAYRRSQVSRLFKTSMADIIMNELSMPLFIAHNK
ncbi:universal stress protein [Mucilaginibacter sp. BJC16-A38]|uniref:universal stress protein n=1 Tax=Mucilaginibacter phenanthrenivorans TaxID=1234842 RepID=UPI0021579035|nr:universal stress protein [Mucilaginibacter phenanthrenivorans]MCR8560810.1 universal stress protein [Mucilaginibacter phenanthrenivorans]